MPYLMQLCPTELKEVLSRKLPMLIPVGTMEYHGSQLPFGTDLFITEGLAQRLEKRVPVVIAPSITYSPTGHAVSGPEQGTIDVSCECFIRMCREILSQYEQMGFKNILLLLHHQSSSIGTLVKAAVLEFQTYEADRSLGLGWWSKGANREPSAVIETFKATLDTGYFGGHGGKGEKEAMLAICPGLVHENEPTGSDPWWNQSSNEADRNIAESELEKLLELWTHKLENMNR